MKTRFSVLIAIILLGVLGLCSAPQSDAFNIKLTNTMDRIMIVRVTWLSCDWEGFPSSHTMFVGEIRPGGISTMENGCKAGHWSIEWSSDDFGVVYEFIVPSDRGILISVPDAMPVFHPGT